MDLIVRENYDEKEGIYNNKLGVIKKLSQLNIEYLEFLFFS